MSAVNGNYNQGRGTAITSPANNKGLHITWTYIESPSNNLETVNKVKNEIQKFAKDTLPKINGHYSIKYDEKKQWGRNSVLLTGQIEQYKQDLDNHLRKTFPNITFAPYRPAHVDVKGNFDTPLYPTITGTQLN